MSGLIIVVDLSVEIVATEKFLMVDVGCFAPEAVLGPEVLR